MHGVYNIKLFLLCFKIPLSEMRRSWFKQNSSYLSLLYYEKKKYVVGIRQEMDDSVQQTFLTLKQSAEFTSM